MPNRNDGTYIRHYDESIFDSKDEHQNDLNDLNYKKLERRTVLMLDLTVLPIVTMFSLLNFLDRVSIGNVRVIGFQKDLDISNIQIAIALTAGFIPYVAIELPSNLVLHKIGAGVLLPLLICGFGIVTFCSGFLTDFEGLVAARFFLGLLEGGVFPGTMLYLSNFYTRNELQLRIAIVQSAACFAGGISGLLTYAIYQIDGFLGRPAWSWVYFIEGLITILFGLVGLFLLPSTPEKSRFLTAAQKRIVHQRMQHDRGGAVLKQNLDRASAYQILQALKSPHVILMCICSFLACTNVYGVAYFQPIVIHSLGFDPSMTQLASVIPYFSAFLVMLGTSYISDKYSLRGATALVCAALSLIGYTTFYCLDDWGQRYGTLFISMAGAYSTQLPVVTWLSNNSEPYLRRATSLAVYTMLGNLGGVMSVWVFAYADRPQYLIPTTMNIACVVGVILLTCINWSYLKYRNKCKITQRGRILAGYEFDIKDYADSEAVDRMQRVAWERLGDRHPDFKYVL